MPPNRPPQSAEGPSWWLIALIVGALIAALAAWRLGVFGGDRELIPSNAGVPPPAAEAPAGTPEPAQSPTSDAAPPPGPTSETDEAAARHDGAARYPVPDLDQAARKAAPLPDPQNSDGPIAQALGALAPRETLARFLNLQDFVRRLVITVDNLPRSIVPTQHSAVRPAPGRFIVDMHETGMVLQAENSTRYVPFVRFAEALDVRLLSSLYVRFYPLLQYEYRQMGFPKGHFNDRVVAAIDDMLAAPTPSAPIRLVQPKVLYRFADPALESLSAGRKIMIRIGPENAARLRVVLGRLRDALTHLSG